MQLKCTYVVAKWQMVGANIEKYTCRVKDAAITKPTEVEAFIGKHMKGKKNDDVAALWINGRVVENFPKGLSKLFPNLTALQISNCGLKQIKKEDLAGFGNLELLCLCDNEITMLDEDLLTNTPKLRAISFENNPIEEVPPKILEPVKKSLEVANFYGNKRLNLFVDKHDNESLATLMMKVFEESNGNDKKRQKIDDLTEKVNDLERERQKFAVQAKKVTVVKEEVTSHSKMFEGLFASGQFSDFTFKVHGKELKVHKCILAAQSLVFSDLFTNGNEDKVKEMKKKVQDFDGEVIEQFLRFFYTRRLETEERLKEIFQLAVYFDVSELKSKCEEAISKSLCEENALEVFNFGVSHSEKLKRTAFDLLKKIHLEIPEYLYEEPECVNSFIKAKIRSAERQ